MSDHFLALPPPQSDLLPLREQSHAAEDLARPAETYDLPRPRETAQTLTEALQDELPPTEQIEIPKEDTITIPEALQFTISIGLTLGKSTLQRWAMKWTGLGFRSPVRALLVTTRTGNSYRLSRTDFEVWSIEQKSNLRPATPTRPIEVPTPPAQPTPMVRTSTESERAVVPPREPATPAADPKDQLIAQLASENTFLRGEITIKNEQLKDATDRSKETNILIHGLQNLVLRLTGQLPAPRGDPRQP
jgi:hypothetical protein